MASPASLANWGSTRPSLSASTPKIGEPPLAIRRIRVISRVTFRCFDRPWWHRPSYARALGCRCMVTTNLVEEAKIQFSPESILKGNSSGSREDEELLLKPPQKPVLKMQPNGPSVDSAKSALSPPNRRTVLEDRDKVIESLGEVLEKAGKLEAATPMKPAVDKSSMKPGNGSKFVRTANGDAAQAKKASSSRSVWRKGNPVTNVQKVVKDQVRVDTGKAEVKKVTTTRTDVKRPVAASSRPSVSSPPRLAPKPAVAPPPPAASPVMNVSGVASVGDVPKVRKQPILIDKFASKKATVDPIASAVLLPPTKPFKGPPPSKLKDERRKKAGAVGGLRKRMVNDEDGIVEDASELGMPIPGVSGARKGKKWSKASRKAARLEAAKAAAPVKVEILEVSEEGMLSEDLAYNLAIGEAEILEYLYSRGVKPDKVQRLDKDMVKMICKEYGVEVLEAGPVRVEEMAKKREVFDQEDLDMLEERPPIITIMGHVDHGKTTLLDYIRKSKVVASEAGGITQGIGAYQVLVPVDGKQQTCVFLDTPGHEAFGAMRARGARVTDIAIIVVAADDGVRPQTNEAIAHAKAAGVPVIIAINKIDKDGASPDRVMQELSTVGLMPEIWGGDTPMVLISALKGENIDELLETVMLVAELQELKANPHRKAKGTVVEAALDKSKGPLATLIVQNGTIRKGDVVVCGGAFGKVRAMFNDRGGIVDKAGPSMAVQVVGLSDVPIAGDEFEVVDSLNIARERASARAESLRAERISAKAGEGKVTLSSIAYAVSAGRQSGLDMHQLNIILKVDFQGSIEAVRHAVQVLPQDNVNLKFLLQAPGDVNVSDIDLAVATEAVIFGFNVKASSSVKSYAEKKNVEVRLYRVIYDLVDDLRAAMEGLLEPVEEQLPIGTAEVRATFSSGSGRVAGCMVTEGKVVKDCGIRVVRNGRTVHTGIIGSLRRVKEEVKEVGGGLECGIGVDDFDNWEEGDVIEAYNTTTKRRTLEEASETVAAALAGAGVDL